MEKEKIKELTAEQYHALYCKAFARLEDLAVLAEQAMQELEELQLTMAEQKRLPNLVALPRRTQPETEKPRKKFS